MFWDLCFTNKLNINNHSIFQLEHNFLTEIYVLILKRFF